MPILRRGFPRVRGEPTPRPIDLSVVIPAYNEASRLPPVLQTTRSYLNAHFGDRYEVIVVDDGSTDSLMERLETLSGDWPQLALIRHPSNLGKGAAVKSGMAEASGDLWLFTDADGATPIYEESRLRSALRLGADIAVGSRTLPSRGTRRFRNACRLVAGWCFARLCHAALPLPVKDTQCGFKMFKGEVGRWLFAQLTESGFAFDLELLALASLFEYRVAEVPVTWSEMPGSKVRLVRDSRRMLRSLIAIRRRQNRYVVTKRTARRDPPRLGVPKAPAR